MTRLAPNDKRKIQRRSSRKIFDFSRQQPAAANRWQLAASSHPVDEIRPNHQNTYTCWLAAFTYPHLPHTSHRSHISHRSQIYEIFHISWNSRIFFQNSKIFQNSEDFMNSLNLQNSDNSEKSKNLQNRSFTRNI